MKTLLITGGSRGIGLATVKAFLKENYTVITTSTTGKVPIQDPNLKVFKLDLGNASSIESLVKDLGDTRIDILINSAGIANKKENKINIEELRKTIDVDLIGMIDLTNRLLPLINEKGVIINISSEFGSLTEDWGNRVPSYRIAKAAINMFTRNFYDDADVKVKKIKVYSFDPGWVKTDMGGPDAERIPEEPAKELLELAESDFKSGLFYRGSAIRDW